MLFNLRRLKKIMENKKVYQSAILITLIISIAALGFSLLSGNGGGEDGLLGAGTTKLKGSLNIAEDLTATKLTVSGASSFSGSMTTTGGVSGTFSGDLTGTATSTFGKAMCIGTTTASMVTHEFLVVNTNATASNNASIFGVDVYNTGETRLTAEHTGAGSQYLNFYTSNTGTEAERMRITGEGYVGIGTASPGTGLVVNNGDIFVSASSSNGLILKDSSGACHLLSVAVGSTLTAPTTTCP